MAVRGRVNRSSIEGSNGSSEGGATRRGLLLGAGGALAAVPLAGSETTLGSSELLSADQVYGEGIAPLWAIFGDLLADRVCYVIGTPPNYREPVAIPVGVDERAILLREDKADLDSFERGDEVMLGGIWLDTGFLALIIEPSYRRLNGRILSIRRNRIDTTEGPVRLNDETRPGGAVPTSHEAAHLGFAARPLSSLRRGDWIDVIGTRNLRADELLAVTVASRAGR
jgi:hypothetical protein